MAAASELLLRPLLVALANPNFLVPRQAQRLALCTDRLTLAPPLLALLPRLSRSGSKTTSLGKPAVSNSARPLVFSPTFYCSSRSRSTIWSTSIGLAFSNQLPLPHIEGAFILAALLETLSADLSASGAALARSVLSLGNGQPRSDGRWAEVLL